MTLNASTTSPHTRQKLEIVQKFNSGAQTLFGTVWEDLPPPVQPPALIQDLFYQGTLSVLVGPSGIGKTKLVLEIGKCVVNGLPFQGRPVMSTGPVLLIDNEMGRAGVHRYCDDLGMTGQFQAVHDVPASELVPLIRAAIAEDCKLVIIDSYTSLATDSADGSGDPLHSATITEKILKPLLTLAHETGICIVVLHHTNKDSETFSGSQRLKSLPDEMYFLTLDEFTKTMTLKASKHRNEITPLSWQMPDHPSFAGGSVSSIQAVDTFQKQDEFIINLLDSGCTNLSTVKAQFEGALGVARQTSSRALKRLVS